MTIEDLAIQGRDANLSSAERTYDNIYKMRNKTLMNTFLKRDMGHRNQLTATINGVQFIDDSLALSPNATWFTFYQTNEPIVWIVENLSKKDIDLKEQVATIKEKVKTVIVIDGEKESKKMLSQLRKVTNIVETDEMSKAVELGFHLAAEGMKVIYSPASGTSDQALLRGMEYNTCVNNL